jgi:hypothetical protein
MDDCANRHHALVYAAKAAGTGPRHPSAPVPPLGDYARRLRVLSDVPSENAF